MKRKSNNFYFRANPITVLTGLLFITVTLGNFAVASAQDIPNTIFLPLVTSNETPATSVDSEQAPSESLQEGAPVSLGACQRPQLEWGARGAHVVHAQQQLLKVGDPSLSGTPANLIDSSGGADGVFKDGTYAAVVAYQRLVFPGQADEHDGIIGPKTWEKLGCNNSDSPEGADGTGPVLPPQPTPEPNSVYAHLHSRKFEDLYFMQSHNTYDHGVSISNWLDQGFRSFELDVQSDRDGGTGWNNDANGPFVAHWPHEVGDKICSAQDNDRLGNCLNDMARWLGQNPNEGPLLVFIDMKMYWDSNAIRKLDVKINQLIGNLLYRPRDLYEYAVGQPFPGSQTLRSAVSSRGWPTMGNLKGKIIIAYTGGTDVNVNQGMSGALEYHLDRDQLPYGFFCPDVEDDDEELEPNSKVDGMGNFASQFVVCSNLEARKHYQVTANMADKHNQLIHLWGSNVYNNSQFTFNYLAVAHGISAIGRDGENSNDITSFNGHLPYMGIRSPSNLPGYFSIEATHISSKCLDVSKQQARNGQDLHLWSCHAQHNQKFVYTAEGQLRPQTHNRYCVDIDGGSARNGKQIHLWDCDDGKSEKWKIEFDSMSNVTFRSYENPNYCLDVSYQGTSNGTKFQTWRCNGSAAQKFKLIKRSTWPQTDF